MKKATATKKVEQKAETPAQAETHSKRLTGVVASNKMKDTIVVVVERFTQHPKYQKYFNSRKRYKVDDKGNTAGIGDTVVIEETRPISKEKSFKLLEITARAKVADEMADIAAISSVDAAV